MDYLIGHMLQSIKHECLLVCYKFYKFQNFKFVSTFDLETFDQNDLTYMGFQSMTIRLMSTVVGIAVP
jgi:hypothetical protein